MRSSPDSKYKSPVFMVFEYAELDLEIVIQSPVVRTIDEPRQKSIVQRIARASTTCTPTKSCTAIHAEGRREAVELPHHAERRRQNLRLWFGAVVQARPRLYVACCYIKLPAS